MSLCRGSVSAACGGRREKGWDDSLHPRDMTGEEGGNEHKTRLRQTSAEGGSFPVLAEVYDQGKI